LGIGRAEQAPGYSWGRNALRNSAVLSERRQVTVTGAETPEALTGALTDGAVEAVSLLLQPPKPAARAKPAIAIQAVFFMLSSSVPPRLRGATGADANSDI
jgi:hypothetical protein